MISYSQCQISLTQCGFILFYFIFYFNMIWYYCIPYSLSLSRDGCLDGWKKYFLLFYVKDYIIFIEFFHEWLGITITTYKRYFLKWMEQEGRGEWIVMNWANEPISIDMKQQKGQLIFLLETNTLGCILLV